MNVYDRIFFIKGQCYGTAFTIDLDGKQYLISAHHVVGETTSLKIYHDQKWKDVPVSIVGVRRDEVDIVVMAPSVRLSSEIELGVAIGGFILGQDVYFAGFPYKMFANGGDVMMGRPLPFVKKGILSAGMDPIDDVKRLYVDAINNEGFSGGPLVFAVPGTTQYSVIGVVSKFKVEYESVINDRDEDTGFRVAYNTGFLLAYSMKHVLDLIKANPIGLPIN